ncbi:MAG TPA: flagellar assembly protein FliW [Nitrospirae bacterium]|nr:flagellar assembly protein FliW [Nitrospirota bacterium]
MISFDTSRFGRLEVAKDRIIHFPGGLMGFPDIKRFILMDYKDTSLKWLQAVDDPDIAFIVTQPFELFPDYSLKIENSIRNFLEVEKEEDMVTLAILRVEGDSVTANLQGPLVINSINKKGIQIVNEDTPFSCKTPLKSLIAPAAK